MPQAPTKQSPVFVSRHTNLRVVRFPGKRADEKDGPQPGLAYEFGHDSGVQDSQGMEVIAGGSVRVTDELRDRDLSFIDEFGDLLVPERPLNRQKRQLLRQGKLDLEEAFLSTEEFLRARSAQTHNFYELPVAAPDPGEALRKVAELAIDGDTEGLVALAEEEAGEWNRQAVLEAVEHALERLSPDEPEAA